MHDAVIAVLPPALRETGASVAAWAGMLLGVAHAQVRIVVPGEGREVRRVARLAESCGMTPKFRLPGWNLTLAELVVAADLVAYLPAGDAPMQAVLWALAAGRPIVASTTPAVTELLVHSRNAWLCRPNSPREAARRMLQVLENPARAREQAEQARTQVFRAVSRRKMIDRVRCVYENLLADRLLATGLEEDALIC